MLGVQHGVFEEIGGDFAELAQLRHADEALLAGARFFAGGAGAAVEEGEALHALRFLAQDFQGQDAAPGEAAEGEAVWRTGQDVTRAFGEGIGGGDIAHGAIGKRREGGDLWGEEALVAKGAGEEDDAGAGHESVVIFARARIAEGDRYYISKALVSLQPLVRGRMP